MRRKKSSQPNSLKIVLVFFVAVIFLIGISLFVRFIVLVKESKFDGEHHFNLLIAQHDARKNASVILSFSPDSRELSIVTIQKKNDPLDVQRFLEVPIDGMISFPHAFPVSSILSQKDVSLLLYKTVLSYQSVDTTITFLDLIRFSVLAQSLPKNAVTSEAIGGDMDQLSIYAIASSRFVDKTLSLEKLSVQIVNGSGISGLGNRLARFIANIGGNVVSVTTADNLVKESTIASDQKNSYTFIRLHAILGFRKEELEKRAISDIIIIIGSDSAKKRIAF